MTESKRLLHPKMSKTLLDVGSTFTRAINMCVGGLKEAKCDAGDLINLDR
jgi:hypothetical protein